MPTRRRYALAAALILLASGSVPTDGSAPALRSPAQVDRPVLEYIQRPTTETTRVLIRVRQGTADRVRGRVDGIQAKSVTSTVSDLLLADLSASTLAVLQGDSDVMHISSDAEIRGFAIGSEWVDNP